MDRVDKNEMWRNIIPLQKFDIADCHTRKFGDYIVNLTGAEGSHPRALERPPVFSCLVPSNPWGTCLSP